MDLGHLGASCVSRRRRLDVGGLYSFVRLWTYQTPQCMVYSLVSVHSCKIKLEVVGGSDCLVLHCAVFRSLKGHLDGDFGAPSYH